MIEHTSSGTVVVKSGLPPKVLIIKVERKNGTFWGLPKGHVDDGESLLDAAIRETVEETGIPPNLLKPLCYLDRITYEFYTYEDGKPTLNTKEVHFFLLETSNLAEAISPSMEEFIFDYRWVTFKEAMELTTFENYRKILKRAEIAFF